MGELFALLVLGHLVGDYLLQNNWMALGKTKSGWICVAHCAVYVVSMTVITWPIIHGLQWSLFIYATHYPIDRLSLAEKWMTLIRSRSCREYMETGRSRIGGAINASEALQGGFTAFVYVVNDNAMHLLLMYYGAKYLFLGG